MEKVRYSDLLPWEFRQRLAARPVAYLPLGTLEWHGEHLPLGSDAIQSEELMIECAKRFGGIVMPPIHLGPDRAWDRGERRSAPRHGLRRQHRPTPAIRRQLLLGVRTGFSEC